MMASAWRMIKAPGLSPYVCKAEVVVDLVRDMAERGGGRQITHEPIRGIKLETSRQIRLKQQLVATMLLDGLIVEVPCQDFEQVWIDVRLAPRFGFGANGTHYRIATERGFLVLSEESRRRFIETMEELAKDAGQAARADDFRLAREIAAEASAGGDVEDPRAAADKAAEAKRAAGLTN